jgi:hypothetical protein
MAALMAYYMCIIRLKINIFLLFLSDAGSTIDFKIWFNLKITKPEFFRNSNLSNLPVQEKEASNYSHESSNSTRMHSKPKGYHLFSKGNMFPCPSCIVSTNLKMLAPLWHGNQERLRHTLFNS